VRTAGEQPAVFAALPGLRRRMKTEVNSSLLGASPEKTRKWAEWYLRVRDIPAVSVGELFELALR
jgi:hypothetical protein